MCKFLVSVFLILLPALSHSVAKLPLESFASLPNVRGIVLSPDGNKLALLLRLDVESIEGSVVKIFDLTDGKSSYPMRAENLEFVITGLQWANNRDLLVSANTTAVRYGVPTTESRLLVVNTKTGKNENILPRRVLRKLDRIPQIQDNVIDILPDDEKHILIALDIKSANEPGVYKLNIENARRKLVKRHRSSVHDWMADQQGRVRIGFYQNGTENRILVKNLETEKWERVWTYESLSEDIIHPLGFDLDPNILYVRAYHNGRKAVFKVNLSDPEYKKELVHADPNYDVLNGLVYSPLTREVVGLRDGPYWNKTYDALQKGIDKVLADTDNILVGFSQNERKYLLYTENPTQPGTYYLGDRDQGSLTIAASTYPNLSTDMLAKSRWVQYEARDGLGIEALLTTPIGVESKNLPTIIHPHGGPISFDSEGFDYWTQFFVNRGYAVLQMNFRGSSGYGYDFMSAGFKSWGQAMQDDVEDGTRWLIDQGIADPNRICIVGGSYGGYAALMGVVKTPDLYRCAVSFAGVTDLAYLVSSSSRYTNYDVVKEQIGARKSELKQYSPNRLADKITAPVLLIHGSKDRVVRVAHSRKMNKALKKAGKQVKYVELEEGNHYLSNNQHRIETFKEMEVFLERHLSAVSSL